MGIALIALPFISFETKLFHLDYDQSLIIPTGKKHYVGFSTAVLDLYDTDILKRKPNRNMEGYFWDQRVCRLKYCKRL